MSLEEFLGPEYYLFMMEGMEERQAANLMGLNQLSDIDLEVCNYVVKHLIPIDIGKINLGKKIDVNELKQICLGEMNKFGDIISWEVNQLLSMTPIVSVNTDDSLQLQAEISYLTTSGVIIENSGSVSRYLIPKNIHEITGYFFGHEQMHAMKETNYLEYINQMVLGEVIPIFYEFMIYNPGEVLKKELIKTRMSYIFDNSLEYSILNDAFNENNLIGSCLGVDSDYEIKKMIYEHARTKMGGYLNSFYYALILYHMYKETPDKIMNLVCKVLMNEMTTLELLQQLGIYGDIKGEVFEKELQNIKKLVR